MSDDMTHEAASEMALAVPPLDMSPAQRDRIRARLLARAAADREFTEPLAATTTSPRAETPPPARPSDVVALRAPRRAMGAAAWMAMAAGLVAIAGLGGFLRASRERDEMR